MFPTPDQWHAIARASLRPLVSHGWRLDEMIGAAVLKLAELHERGVDLERPSIAYAICRFAGIDELRRLEGKHDSAEAWPTSLDALAKPSGDPFDLPDDQPDDFEREIVDRIVDQCRAGEIMGADLSPLLRRIVRLLARGYTQAQIAEHTGYSRPHVTRLVNQLRAISEQL